MKTVLRFSRQLRSLVAVFLLIVSVPAIAQDAGSASFGWIRTTIVKFGQQDAYANLRKQISEEAAKQRYPVAINVYSPLVSDGAEFQIVSTYDDLPTLLNQAPARAVVESSEMLDIIESSGVQIYRRRPDLERVTDPIDLREVAGWHIYLTTVRPGKEALEEEYLKALKRAADKVAPDSVWIVSSPGINTGNVYRVAVPTFSDPTGLGNVNDWLVEAFGEQEARRLRDLRNEARQSVHRTYMRHRPDLSYYPE